MKTNIASVLFFLSVVATLVFILSGYGYQWGIWSLGTGFTLLTNSAYAAIGLLLANTIMLFFLKNADMKPVTLVLIGVVCTATVAGVAFYWQNEARKAPPIHDISTDLENPPEFIEMIPLRADAPNPPEYAGEETAEIQRENYPDIATVWFSAPNEEVFNAAVAVVEERGWELVNSDAEEGIIEATEKLAWFGFKDDVVLRIGTDDDGTRVDMRSKSRIGRGDVGVNAKRIMRFFEDLEERVQH
ncbi:MAG: DUF1499 domain-containing protein [Balneolaceae bacterium]